LQPAKVVSNYKLHFVSPASHPHEHLLLAGSPANDEGREGGMSNNLIPFFWFDALL